VSGRAEKYNTPINPNEMTLNVTKTSIKRCNRFFMAISDDQRRETLLEAALQDGFRLRERTLVVSPNSAVGTHPTNSPQDQSDKGCQHDGHHQSDRVTDLPLELIEGGHVFEF
jgi:hypothetical protein